MDSMTLKETEKQWYGSPRVVHDHCSADRISGAEKEEMV